MRTKLMVAVLLATLPFSAHVSAQAQSIRQVFQEFDLIGVWASACARPANFDEGTAQMIFALARPDTVMLTYDNGPKYNASAYSIVSATRAGRDRLTYTAVRLQDQKQATVTVQKVGDEMTVVSSVLPDGTVLVRDGRRTASGIANPRQVRCQK